MNVCSLFVMPPLLHLSSSPSVSQGRDLAGKERIFPISFRGSRSPCRNQSQTKVSCKKGKEALAHATCPHSEWSGCVW